MARIRSIKPGFFLNEELAAMPFQWRLLFIGLWTQADRAGRLEDRPARLKASLFPYDDLDINEGLGCLANAGLIVRYDGSGQHLIAIPTWAKHQQPHVKESPSELPPPASDEHGADTGPAPLIRKGADPDQEGKGSLSLVAPAREPSVRERFDRFWTAYPKKVGKDKALRVFEAKRFDEATLEQMLAAIAAQSKSPQWLDDGGRYIPHPSTWLNQGRWQDEIPVPSVAAAAISPAERRHAEAVRRAQLGCQHAPKCETYQGCIELMVLQMRRRAS